MLIDSLNKKIDYLRISVTDRCNLRCTYCMPQNGIENKCHDEILTFEEILRMAGIFSSLGIRKIRLTGGEPLVRRGVISLIKGLTRTKGIDEVHLTTNGTLLSSYAEELKKAGLKRINISLDTLRPDRYKDITRKHSFYAVMEGIKKAKEAGLYPIKLNMVVMKGINDDEIIDFIDFAQSEDLGLRFIEFMKITPLWREDYFIPIEEIIDICRSKYALESIDKQSSSPALYYKTKNNKILGFIKTDEKNCWKCNRLRLTSTGELKICLYETQGLCLKNLLRLGVCDEEIRDIIKAKMEMKSSANYTNWETHKTYMCAIGG